MLKCTSVQRGKQDRFRCLLKLLVHFWSRWHTVKRKTCSVTCKVMHREQSSPVAPVCQKETSSSEPFSEHVSFSFVSLFHASGMSQTRGERLLSYGCRLQSQSARSSEWKVCCTDKSSSQALERAKFCVTFISIHRKSVHPLLCAIPRSFSGALASSCWRVATISHPMDDVLRRQKEEGKKSSSKKEEPT